MSCHDGELSKFGTKISQIVSDLFEMPADNPVIPGNSWGGRFPGIGNSWWPWMKPCTVNKDSFHHSEPMIF